MEHNDFSKSNFLIISQLFILFLIDRMFFEWIFVFVIPICRHHYLQFFQSSINQILDYEDIWF